MKRLLPVFLCLLILQKTNGQRFINKMYYRHEINLDFTTMYSSIDFQIADGNKLIGEPNIGYGLNLFFTNNFNNYLSLKTGLMYHSLFSYIQTPEREEYRIHLNNMHIPLLFQLNTDKNKFVNYSIFAGPQVCINISSSYKAIKVFDITTTATVRVPGSELSVNMFDYGFAYGGGAEIALNRTHSAHLNLGYLGTFGFAAVNGTDETSTSILPDKTTKKTYGGYLGLSCSF